MGNPMNPTPELQMRQVNPTDKYIAVVIPDGTKELQVIAGGNQTIEETLALISGALQVIAAQLLAMNPPGSVINPFAGPTRMNPNGDKNNG